MLVARHFHHLLDGAVLVTRVKRPIHIVVGLDWAATPFVRRWMERVCRAAEYPIVLRRPTVERTGSFRREELVRYTRTALRETTRLLRDGRVVLVFPEAYPTIDPTGTRKPHPDAWLPFATGFLTMLAHAERDGGSNVMLIPVGFDYERAGDRWSIAAQIGQPLARDERDVTTIEMRVRALSRGRAAAVDSASPAQAPH